MLDVGPTRGDSLHLGLGFRFADLTMYDAYIVVDDNDQEPFPIMFNIPLYLHISKLMRPFPIDPELNG